MSNYKKIILTLSIFSFIITSCDTTEDIEMDRSIKPTANIVGSSITVNEGEAATVEISIDKAVAVPLIYKLKQVDGNAIKDENFSFATDSAPDYGSVGGKIVIPAYETSGTLEINTNLDYFDATDYNANFVLEPMESMNGLAGSGDFSLTIKSIAAANFVVKLNWDEVDASDLDMFMFAPDGSGYPIWTANVPEVGEMIASDAVDGTYYLGIDPYAVEAGVTEFPINWSFAEPNGEASTLTQIFDYENRDVVGTYTTMNYSGTTAYITVKIEKTGNDFVITAM